MTLIVCKIIDCIGCAILVWNEFNATKRCTTIDEGAKVVMNVQDPLNASDPTMDGTIVHLIGVARNNDINIGDPDFRMTNIPGILKLHRNVEMYQWIEKIDTNIRCNHTRSSNSLSAYKYTKEWKSTIVDSDDFHDPTFHNNPNTMSYESKTWISTNVCLGDFRLSSDIVKQMDWYVPLSSSAISTARIPTDFIDSLPLELRDQVSMFALPNGGLYIGIDPKSPEIGDIRIKYTVVPEQRVSVLGRQVNGSVTSYIDAYRSDYVFIEPGIHTAPEMFRHITIEVLEQTWFIRLFGFLFFCIGFQFRDHPVFNGPERAWWISIKISFCTWLAIRVYYFLYANGVLDWIRKGCPLESSAVPNDSNTATSSAEPYYYYDYSPFHFSDYYNIASATTPYGDLELEVTLMATPIEHVQDRDFPMTILQHPTPIVDIDEPFTVDSTNSFRQRF